MKFLIVVVVDFLVCLYKFYKDVIIKKSEFRVIFRKGIFCCVSYMVCV